MTEAIKQKIVQWIFDNHNHHEDSKRSEATLDIDEKTMSEFQEIEGTCECPDADYPYVNSMELEKFILSLGVKP